MEPADEARVAAEELGAREGLHDVPEEREDVERDEENERGPHQGTSSGRRRSRASWREYGGRAVSQRSGVPVLARGPYTRLIKAKKKPVDSPHIRMPVKPSTVESMRHSFGSTRSPKPTVAYVTPEK